MTTELQTADNRHNHPPRCCCDDGPELGGTGPCPACPDHGTPPPTVECPQCHQPAGRPHTEYCPLQLREDVFAGETPLPVGSIIRANVTRWPGSISWPAGDTSNVLLELRANGYWTALEDDPVAPFAVPPICLDSIIVLEVVRSGGQHQGQTSQPATRTSQPPTQIRGEKGPELLLLGEPTGHVDLVGEVTKAIREAHRRNGRGIS